MGTQTYGKGTVQSSIDMNRLVNPSILQRLAALAGTKTESGKSDKDSVKLGQINLTIAKFYRVTGSSTQHKGVMPDIEFPSLYPMDKIGEDTAPSALLWDEVQKSNFIPVANLNAIKGELITLHKQRMDKSIDYKVMEEDIAESKKRQGKVSVSLNEGKLKAERDSLEAKNLARINFLRSARGLPAVKKGDKVKKEELFDFVQNESLKVMADLMDITKSKEVTKTTPGVN